MRKDLYAPGEIPPLGHVPRRMYGSLIRRERYGQPIDAFQVEVVDVPPVGPGKVLVLVMAAGVNYNNVWAALGKPLDVISMRLQRGDPEPFHIGGSDGSGIVWRVGDGVKQLKVGDHVVLSGSRWDERAEDIRLGGDPIASSSHVVQGYEENYGTFAQFTVVEEYQCHPKPKDLTWEDASCFLVTGATAYRQLFGWSPHTVRPGDPVLIWGGAGGLGSMAIQLVKLVGGIPIAVASSRSREDHCIRLGAKGTLNRLDFDHWGRLPDLNDTAALEKWTEGARAFGRRFWEIVGERRGPRIVLEHPGQDTIPTSLYLCEKLGMVVTCGGTSGYNADFDLRFLWTRQKRLQGSHFASVKECRAVTHLVASGKLTPCRGLTLPFEDIGKAHQWMFENRHPPGNMSVLVSSPAEGVVGVVRGGPSS